MKHLINPLKKLAASYTALFTPATIEEVMVHDANQASIIVRQVKETIRTQEYLGALAEARLRAIEEFKRKYI